MREIEGGRGGEGERESTRLGRQLSGMNLIPMLSVCLTISCFGTLMELDNNPVSLILSAQQRKPLLSSQYKTLGVCEEARKRKKKRVRGSLFQT